MEDEELQATIIPLVELNEVKTQLESNKTIIIEFYGPKGQGKTTHLKLLNQLIIKSDFIDLDHDQFPTNLTNNRILLIDGIERMKLSNRLALWKTPNLRIAYTTHKPLRLEHSLFSFRKKIIRVNFNNLTFHQLKSIIDARILLKQNYSSQKTATLKTEYLEWIYKKHDKNLRAIIKSLFRTFQQYSYD